MRTIIFADTAYPVIGGGQVHLHNFYTYLKKRGHQARVFTNITQTTNGDGKDYIRIKWPSKSLLGLIKFFRLVSKLITPCDIIYCLYSYRLSAIVVLASKIQHKPIL
mgnify:CR=1 FL=1